MNMTVRIHTFYLGNNDYSISVVANGAVVNTVGATRWTVVGVRNRLAEKWADEAREVEADPVPEAFDIING